MTPKRLRKSIGILFLVGALVATQIPDGSFAARLSTKDEFQLDGDILVKYTGTADTVSVPSAVKVIGEEAFCGNENIVSITLPDNLEEISYSAFSGCNKLKKITIPDSCETLATASFANCTSLSKITIGKGLKSMGNGVFLGCNNLTDITIDSGNFILDDNVIYNKDKTKLIEVLPSRKKDSLTVPETVSNIYPYAFYDCDSIEKVSLPSKMGEITAYSFSGCSSLKSVTIPYSVKNIDAKAFENCSNLSYVKIPESVSYIHATAFDGCNKLNIDAPAGSYAYNWFLTFDKSDVAAVDSEDNDVPADSDNEEAENADKEEENTTSVITPSQEAVEDGLSQTKVVGRQAVIFIDNTVQTVKGNTGNDESAGSSTSQAEDDDIQSSDTASETDDSIAEEIINVIQNESKGKGLNLPKLAIINNTIAGKAFYNDKTLKSYEVPEGIISVGDFSFARSGLESIKLSEGLENIGYGAFYHCDNLKEVEIPSSVKNVEASAFEKTAWYENWEKTSSDDFLIVGDGVLIGYKGTSSIVHIPDEVKVIGAEVFKDHKGITDVYLPDSLEAINEGAFSGCINLKYLSKGSYLRRIEDRAFYGCPIETIRIVDTVSSVGIGAYDYSDSSIDDSQKVVYFHGSVLPSLDYVKTTTRLSNYDYRTLAFNDVKVAIVENEDIELKNTVLDSDLPGFRGLICIIDKSADAFESGSLKIIACNLSADEAESFSVAEEVEIYGKKYKIDSKQLSDFIDNAKAGFYEPAEDEHESYKISGSDKSYVLNVSKTNNKEDIEAAYLRIYGQEIPDNSPAYNISLYEVENGILLTKMGKRKVEVKLNLPSNIATDNLHLITIDEDSQLEDISYVVEDNNGQMQIVFNMEHTGKYALYNANTNTSLGLDIDESPETGDFIHPKWILSIGLLCAALAMFLIKGKK